MNPLVYKYKKEEKKGEKGGRKGRTRGKSMEMIIIKGRGPLTHLTTKKHENAFRPYSFGVSPPREYENVFKLDHPPQEYEYTFKLDPQNQP